MTKINCDMGESFGIYNAGNDEEIMPLIDIANVACGFHASDPNHMRKTVELAKKIKLKLVPTLLFQICKVLEGEK